MVKLPAKLCCVKDGEDPRDVDPRDAPPESEQEYPPNSSERSPADSLDLDHRRRIVIGADLARVTDEVIEAISVGKVYQRGGCLMDVVRDPKVGADRVVRPAGAAHARLLPMARLRENAGLAAVFVRLMQKGDEMTYVVVAVPTDVLRALASRGEWSHIRPLRGISQWPVLRPDGTILDQPGYDLDTGLLCEPTVVVRVPESPTREDARDALRLLKDLVNDFPFPSDAHRSAWVAALLSVLARPAIDGPVPLTLVDANERGSGKSLLCDVIGVILSGRRLPRRTAPDEPAEWRKAMLAIAIAADPVILIDNVTRTLRSDALDTVLTGTEYRERALGRNKEVVAEVRTVFLATSNNATLSTDLVRRSIHVRLEAGEDPARRTGFRHPDLLGHVRDDRALYLAAALTVLRAHVVAGRPIVPLRPMGSYDAWSSVVRAAIVWAGWPDPADTQDGLRDSSEPERDDLEAVLRAWHELYGAKAVTVDRVLSDLGAHDSSPRERALGGALASWCDARPGQSPSSRQVSNRLRANRNRIVGGLVLEGLDKDRDGKRWRVRDTHCDSGDSRDSVSHPSCETDVEIPK